MADEARAAVVAAHPLAAQAGAAMLTRGGSAVDAAVAAAFALAVVDPQNCGIGGHGGALLVQPAARAAVSLIDFNTAVPAEFASASYASAPRCGQLVVGGASVSVPAVVAGLEAAHRAFGRLAFGTLVEPAVALARDGHPLGPDLARALAWAEKNHPELDAGMRSIFFAGARPHPAGALLKQPQLARTLEKIAKEGARAFYRGGVAEAICACVCRNGGKLAPSDLERVRVDAGPAQPLTFSGARLHGPRRDTSGYGIICDALTALDTGTLGANRSAQYAQAVTGALRHAWSRRAQAMTPLSAGHTTHLCACDANGMLASMTFTHGPTWFGSGLVVEDAGILLNSGANLFVRSKQGGKPYAVHNMSPVIVEHDGARHAIGSPGGPKIPAIVMQMIVDAVHYELAPSAAIGLARLSLAPDGRAEAEAELLSAMPPQFAARAIEREEYYGPATALTLDAAGRTQVALDPRFAPGAATA